LSTWTCQIVSWLFTSTIDRADGRHAVVALRRDECRRAVRDPVRSPQFAALPLALGQPLGIAGRDPGPVAGTERFADRPVSPTRLPPPVPYNDIRCSSPHDVSVHTGWLL